MKTEELKQIANKLRLEAIRMIYEGKDGHPGPALSIADIVASLYSEQMRIDPKNPSWEDRDRLILSKGHACPIVYAALSELGYYGKPSEHFNLRGLCSTFQGHPVMGKTPGIDFTSGSLGNGIAIGAGMAAAGKYQKKDFTVYVISGDGEMQEGVMFEGMNFAASKRLDNLVVFVDKNGWQSGDRVEAIMGQNNIEEKFEACGWHTQEISGHDFDAIRTAVATAKASNGKPSAIVCNTVKGKGLPYMENDNNWHKGVPSDEQYATALSLFGGASH